MADDQNNRNQINEDFFDDSFFAELDNNAPRNTEAPAETQSESEKRLCDIIPLDFARANLVAPVEYSKEHGSVTVLALENHSPQLLDELSRKSLGLRIIIRRASLDEIQRQLSALAEDSRRAEGSVSATVDGAAELESLKLENAPVDKLYVAQDISGAADIHKSVSGRHDTGIDEPKPITEDALESSPENDTASGERSVLFVTPTGSLSGHLLFALRAEGMFPVVVSTVAEAEKHLQNSRFYRVFAHSSFGSECQRAIDRIAESKRVAQAPVVSFDNEKDILLGDVSHSIMERLITALAKLSCELATDDRHSLNNPSAQLAELVKSLGAEFELRSEYRLASLAAAYTHRVSSRDLADSGSYSSEDVVRLSRSRLESCSAPETVTTLLDCLLESPAEDECDDPQLSLACDILHLAYEYVVLRNDSSVLDGREKDLQISRRLQKLATTNQRKAIVNSIVRGFSSSTPDNLNKTPDIKVFALSRRPITHGDVQKLLDIRCALLTFPTAEKLVTAWKSGRPDALVIIDDRSHEEVRDLLLSLALRGVVTDEQPTTLIVTPEVAGAVSWMIKSGVEDVLCGDGAFDALAAKLDRMRARREEADRERESALHDMGTHGTLSDMSVFSLLEALRNNQRPVRLSVTAQGSQLTAFISNDRVVSAECDGFTGVEAFSQCLTWKQGIWSIDPLAPEKLPSATLDKPISSVLLEACVNCDETARNLKAFQPGG